MRNPKLLSLLRQGCSMWLGYFYIIGLPDRNMIQYGNGNQYYLYPDGYEEPERLDTITYTDLNEEGLEIVLKERDRYESIDEDVRKLYLQERKEEME